MFLTPLVAHAEMGCCTKTEELPFERFLRTGRPDCVSPLAYLSCGKHDCGYYVGGGAPVRGEGACVNEGTWGYDYCLRPSRVQLNWWHGARYQGGAGQFHQNRLKTPVRNSLMSK